MLKQQQPQKKGAYPFVWKRWEKNHSQFSLCRVPLCELCEEFWKENWKMLCKHNNCCKNTSGFFGKTVKLWKTLGKTVKLNHNSLQLDTQSEIKKKKKKNSDFLFDEAQQENYRKRRKTTTKMIEKEYCLIMKPCNGLMSHLECVFPSCSYQNVVAKL